MAKLAEAQKRYIEKLQPGQRATGVVKSFHDFGAFVSIGLVSGLLHNKNIKWGRVEHPEHHLRIGQKLEIIILDVDKEKHRFSVGLKQLQPDPWDRFTSRFKVGSTVAASVLFVKPFGLIMEIVPGIEALLHISDLPGNINEIDIMNEYQPDQSFEVIIKELDVKERKLKLSMS